MPTEFHRTLRSLDADRPRILLWPVLAITAAWTGWMGLAQIPVYETTRSARIEVSRAAYPVASLVSGRVTIADIKLGDKVNENQTLVKLDSTSSELQRNEAEARMNAVRNRLSAIQQEIASENQTLSSIRDAREKGMAELQARIVRSEAQLQLARQHAERLRKLKSSMAISPAELEQAESNLKENEAGLAEAKATLERTRLDRLTQESECNTRIVRLNRETVEMESSLKIEQATIDRLDKAIGDHTITAPVAGRVDEVGQMRVGSVVTAAQKIAVVVPAGKPRAVASFPVIVVGRIRKGQAARLRMDGFPWTQYGTVPAEVTQVGTEPEKGMIRVELALKPDPNSGVPIEHGLTGSVEIEVERTCPAVIALRAAGQFLGTRRDAT